MCSLETLLLATLLTGAGETVLLDFSASWCGPCRRMEPIVERLAATGVPVKKVDIDQNPNLAKQYRVQQIPCFVMIVNGQEVDRVVGGTSYQRLQQMASRAQTPAPEPAGPAPTRPVLLDFSARWCGPCRQMEPVVDQLEKSEGVVVRKVDIEAEPELARRYQVQQIPCFVMLVDGRETGRVVGKVPLERLRQLVGGSPRAAGTQRGFGSRLAGLFRRNRGEGSDGANGMPPVDVQTTQAAFEAASPEAAVAGAMTQAPLADFVAPDITLPANWASGNGRGPQGPPAAATGHLAGATARSPAGGAVRGSLSDVSRSVPGTSTAGIPSGEGPAAIAIPAVAQPSGFAGRQMSGSAPLGDPSELQALANSLANSRATTETLPAASAPQPPAATADPTEARRRALQATVRLRLTDQTGVSYGTGVIVDTHDDEALVVTCGHLFRESKGRGQLVVTMFTSEGPRDVPAQVLQYHAQDRDIAVVAIRSGPGAVAAPVAPPGHRSHSNDTVFSIGCDRGGAPQLKEGQVTTVNRYLGAPNIQASGQPVEGRSGGGLFTNDGVLIGICNAADPTDDEGIYASWPNVHWLLDQIGQQRIYQQAATPAPRPRAVAAAGTRQQAQPPSQIQLAQPAQQTQQTQQTQLASGSPNPAALGEPVPGQANSQLICIVRPGGDASQERVVVVPAPSSRLLDQIQQEASASEMVVRGQRR